jgi:hypothetical protein
MLLCLLPGLVLAQEVVDAHAVVWAGGRSSEEAKQHRERWSVEAPLAAGVVALPGDAPRLVKSDDVPGLKPGFHVLLLGLCESAAAGAVLPLLQALYPGTYVRPVRVPAAQLACPRPEHGAKVLGKETLVQGTRSLTVTLLRTERGSPGDNGPRLHVRTVLRDADGKQVDAQVRDMDEDAEGRSGCEVSLRRKGGTLVLRTGCSTYLNHPFCTPTVQTTTATLSPGPEKVVVREQESTSGGECDWSGAD